MTGTASLVTMAQNVIGRNIANLEDLGEIKYDVARPILKQITNPEQLRSLELSSPPIAANDAELWKGFVVRDIPDWKSKNVQSLGFNNWCYELYCKLKEDEENEREQQEEQLRRAMKQMDKKKEGNQSQILHRVVQEDVHRLPEYVDGLKNPLANRSNLRIPTTASPRPAKGGGQIIRALRQQSRQAVQAKSLSTPFGATTSRFMPTKTTKEPDRNPTLPTVKMRMSHYENGESRGEKSLRLAIEAEKKEKEESERQKRVEMKKKRREQSVHNAFNRAAKPESRSLSPPSVVRRPRIRPASRSPVRPPPARAASPPPQRTSSPFEMPDAMAIDNQDGKAKSPTPTITLNDEQEKPAIPVFVLPAARRRPVSIFAPKPRRRV